MIDISDNEFNQLKEHLNRICGIDIPAEKSYLFNTRLKELLVGDECKTFAELCQRLQAGNDRLLQRRFVQAMTTHESSFFRDHHPFETLQRHVLPIIAAQQFSKPSLLAPRIRILSSGCSAGQESYSIGISVHEWLSAQKHFSANEINIVGIDISSQALAKATRAVYSEFEIGRFLPRQLLPKYFKNAKGQWEVIEEIRRMVSFAEVNLADNFGYIGTFDIIFCRNVIIYFSQELKQRIISQFRRMLNPGGVLFLGACESLYGLSKEFRAVHEGEATYYVAADAG